VNVNATKDNKKKSHNVTPHTTSNTQQWRVEQVVQDVIITNYDVLPNIHTICCIQNKAKMVRVRWVGTIPKKISLIKCLVELL
jgi:hypothetical protein